MSAILRKGVTRWADIPVGRMVRCMKRIRGKQPVMFCSRRLLAGMKNPFATLATLVGLLLSSPLAFANCHCQQGMLHGTQCVAPVGPNQSWVAIGMAVCSGYSGNSAPPPPPRVIYVYDYLNMLWSRSGHVDDAFFFRTRHPTPHEGDFDPARADQEALDACNAHPKYGPCKHATSVMGDGCIAFMDSPDISYSQAGNTCEAAKELLVNRCMDHYKNSDSCSAEVRYKQPLDIVLGQYL